MAFDNNAIKSINEICKCDPVEGVSSLGEDIIEDKPATKYSSIS